MSDKADTQVVIIAGPNGEGKTTFAREFLPTEAGCPVFINAASARLSPEAARMSALPLKSNERLVTYVLQIAQHEGRPVIEASSMGWIRNERSGDNRLLQELKHLR